MSRFGVTDVGEYSPNQSFINEITGGLHFLPIAGVAVSMAAYLRYAGIDGKSKCGIYDSLGNFVAGTEEITTTVDVYEGWRTYNFPSPVSLAPGSYYLVIWGDDPLLNNWNHVARASGYPDEQKSEVVAYDSWPATFSPGESSYRLSIYCSYTSSPPPSTNRLITSGG